MVWYYFLVSSGCCYRWENIGGRTSQTWGVTFPEFRWIAFLEWSLFPGMWWKHAYVLLISPAYNAFSSFFRVRCVCMKVRCSAAVGGPWLCWRCLTCFCWQPCYGCFYIGAWNLAMGGLGCGVGVGLRDNNLMGKNFRLRCVFMTSSHSREEMGEKVQILLRACFLSTLLCYCTRYIGSVWNLEWVENASRKKTSQPQFLWLMILRYFQDTYNTVAVQQSKLRMHCFG